MSMKVISVYKISFIFNLFFIGNCPFSIDRNLKISSCLSRENNGEEVGLILNGFKITVLTFGVFMNTADSALFFSLEVKIECRSCRYLIFSRKSCIYSMSIPSLRKIQYTVPWLVFEVSEKAIHLSLPILPYGGDIS